jgi:hypothetical protein
VCFNISTLIIIDLIHFDRYLYFIYLERNNSQEYPSATDMFPGDSICGVVSKIIELHKSRKSRGQVGHMQHSRRRSATAGDKSRISETTVTPYNK